MALLQPDRMIGIHLSTPEIRPYTGPGTPALSTQEQAYVDHVARWDETERGYGAVESTRPQTLGYGLNDSPAGLAAWVLDKWRSWSDSGGDLSWPISLVQQVWVFGSFARGACEPQDVDVAVRFERDERMRQAVVEAILSGRANPYAPLRRALAGTSRGLQFQFEDHARERLRAEGTAMLSLWQRGDTLPQARTVLHSIPEDPSAGRAERHDMIDAFTGLDRYFPRPVRAELIAWRQRGLVDITRIPLPDAPGTPTCSRTRTSDGPSADGGTTTAHRAARPSRACPTCSPSGPTSTTSTRPANACPPRDASPDTGATHTGGSTGSGTATQASPTASPAERLARSRPAHPDPPVDALMIRPGPHAGAPRG
ncbi:hypothetical protein OG948_56960 (plasmid) [Embleya sp. NBC_00888]|uniref:hypothetical protein n=1 Tax=Embleya sp. NBC_00888 TaxID=2975960 RepID=UPI002F91A52D|nr:hypothetical protein OG948_56960 [Embleya sp. NBC_00888]